MIAQAQSLMCLNYVELINFSDSPVSFLAHKRKPRTLVVRVRLKRQIANIEGDLRQRSRNLMLYWNRRLQVNL
jgi:hypothetical protein